MPAVLVALVFYLALTNQYFFTNANLQNIIIQGSQLALVSFGMTFVVLCGELDLSVGAGVALVSVVSAIVMRDSHSVPLGILAGLGVGLALGAINGLIVTRLEVPSFIATLGTLTVAAGLALQLSGGQVVVGIPQTLGSLANDRFLGVNSVIWLVTIVLAILWVIQRQTTFGVRMFATGGNREAARLSGIGVDRMRFWCFVVTGATMGIAGLALTARVQSGQPVPDPLLNLDAVAAIVVGGTSLAGGRGSVTRTVWGVLLIATLNNGLQVIGVSYNLEQVIIGVVFIAAASVELFRRTLRRRSVRRAALSRSTRVPPGVPTAEGRRHEKDRGVNQP